MITNHPSQHAPVDRLVGDCGLAVDSDRVPAWRALTEHVHRVGPGMAENWPSAELRVGSLDPAVAGHSVTLYLISGTRPVTFAAVNPRP